VQVPSPLPTTRTSPQPQAPVQAEVHMTGTGEQGASAEVTSGDWVVVPPGGVSPDPANTSLVPPTTSAPATSISPHPTTASNTPLPEFGTSPNAFGGLGDLDTAGDALAGYGDTGGDMGDDLGLDMDVGMDDSAFGEAFHGVEPRDQGDDSHGDGL